MPVTLYGYKYSVYTRIARMALALRDVSYTNVETNPFADPCDKTLQDVSPFHRVPVLDHDGFTIFETSAITRYVAANFPGFDLVPTAPQGAARMQQVISIVDAHAYWPLVRQVFSHAVARPFLGEPADQEQISLGLKSAKLVLQQLEIIAQEGLVLVPEVLTLADLHLAPMIGYFAMAKVGQAQLTDCPALSDWWRSISSQPVFVATDPGISLPN